MAKLVYEGNVQVHFLTAVADIDAPTTVEIGAGTDLTPFLTKNGVAVPNTQNMVDASGLSEVFNAEVVGSWGGGPVELTMYRDDVDETNAYDLVVYGTLGFLVIARFNSIASAAKVEVWPVEMHEPTLMPSAKDEMQTFKAAFAVTSAPSMRAAVA